MLYPVISERYNIVGRRRELAYLGRIGQEGRAAIVVVYGRRRVGKTTIIEHAYKERAILKIEGSEGGDKSHQIETALIMLAAHAKDPAIARLKFTRWLEFFEYLARFMHTGEHTLYIEELQWLASYSDEFIADFKIAWDNLLKQNERLIVVLCGSSPSFMVNHVLKSKALYGRAQHELHVEPFTIQESKAYFGDSYAAGAVMDAYLSVGGIPEYLSYLRRSKSPYLELCQQSFIKDGYFLNECERVFISSLAKNSHYRHIMEVLAQERFLTRTAIATKLKIEAGGTLSTLLFELEASGFINGYVPYNKQEGSKLVRYEIADQYLQFFYRFIAPQKKKISQDMYRDTPTRALNLTEYQQWLGYSFERWCRANHAQIARLLGFSAVSYDVGPFFSRSTPERFQMDLLFARADRVITIAEIKYTRAPVGQSVIRDFERKMELFVIPHRHSIQRVLISAEGADASVSEARYFDDIITLDRLFTDGGNNTE